MIIAGLPSNRRSVRILAGRTENDVTGCPRLARGEGSDDRRGPDAGLGEQVASPKRHQAAKIRRALAEENWHELVHARVGE